VDLFDLSDTMVQREWSHVDILCVSDKAKLVVLIENKIDSGEGEGQLDRYLKKVKGDVGFSGYKILPVYLTPDGEPPEDEGPDFIAVDYSLVCQALRAILETRRSAMAPDVLTTVSHYHQMLQRHIVSDSQIAELAKRIYEKHKRALDIIIEHRPDQRMELANHLKQLIGAEPTLQADYFTSTTICFLPIEWKDIADLNQGKGNKPILLFQFDNYYPGSLSLRLCIGQSEPAGEPVRRILMNLGQKYPGLGLKQPKKLGTTFNAIWSVKFPPENGEATTSISDMSDLFEKVTTRWTTYFATELPPLVAAIKREFGA
jgi:PD-(D/E)XK nuclease superfamily